MNALLNPTSPATDLPVHGHLINGQHVADAVRMQDVWNPSTGAVGSRVAIAGKATVEAAIAAAQAAFPAWRATPPAKRARIMFRFRDLLEQHAEEICT
jgi:malonate-semialdehyde dehydrogenase (acetylating)/methylmalonate-semialdehyde dehydrogenase